MGYLILALFTSILLLASGSLQRDNTSSAETYTQGTVNQQATDTMRYLTPLLTTFTNTPSAMARFRTRSWDSFPLV